VQVIGQDGIDGFHRGDEPLLLGTELLFGHDPVSERVGKRLSGC